MKNIKWLIVCLGFIVWNGGLLKAQTIDYAFEAAITKTETKTMTVPDDNCGGITITGATYDYDETTVNTDFTVFSFRVFKKSNLNTSIYEVLNIAKVNGGNFNTTSGKLTYTVAGIPKSTQTLVVRLYLNANGTGTAYAEREISGSGAGPGNAPRPVPVFGKLTFGDIGLSNAVNGAAGFITGGSIASDGDNRSVITVNIEDQETTNYVVNVTLSSNDGTPAEADHLGIITPIVHAKTATSFKVLIIDDGVGTQNLNLDCILLRAE
jgi:hypothetical protein